MKRLNFSFLVMLWSIFSLASVACEKNATGSEDPAIYAKGISMDKSAVSLLLDEQVTLKAVFDEGEVPSKNYAWHSSDEDVVSAEKKTGHEAILTAKKMGSAVVTYRSEDGELSATCNVEVSDGVIRILAIGNSFSEDAVEHYLYKLAEAGGIPVIIGNMYIAGATLDTHVKEIQEGKSSYSYRKIVDGVKTTKAKTSLATALADERWDYVSFQQGSPYAGLYDTYLSPLSILYNYVTNELNRPNVKYILHQTWAYAQSFEGRGFASYNNDQMTMYTSIVSAYNQVKNNGLIDAQLIIPAGTAIQNGRTAVIGDNFCRDGYHLDLNIGRYTASCAWYEALFGESVIGNTFKPAALSDFEKEIAQNAAHLAVQNPNAVTPMTDYQTWPWAGESPDEIRINFGNATTVPTGWNAFSNGTTAGFTLANLKDKNGNSTSISMELVSRFHGQNSAGPTTTNTGRDLPESVSKNSFYGESRQAYEGVLTVKSELKLKGLLPNKQYNLCFFGSRGESPDNRITDYTVKGKTESSVLLNTSNNTTNVVCVENMSPDANAEITIEVKADTGNNTTQGFYYLGAMWISSVD